MAAFGYKNDLFQQFGTVKFLILTQIFDLILLSNLTVCHFNWNFEKSGRFTHDV